MKLDKLDIEFERLSSAVQVFCADVDAADWIAGCSAVREQGGRLVALWGSEAAAGYAINAALATARGLVVLRLALEGELPTYPGIELVFPAANRMQRAAFDLLGLIAQGSDDARPWLRHAAWGADEYPLRRNFSLAGNPQPETAAVEEYQFVRVEGDAVHEIAVGPVHAGTIESGHFRFSVVGERVLRLEERLGYKHKGIERLFVGMALAEGARLAARVSGDSTVAYGWAYAMACESACGASPPLRSVWVRALLLERERIANHLGDLGFLGNDAGLAFGQSQFSCLKEDWLRTNEALFGHRYLMDLVVPGGVARDVSPSAAARILDEADKLETAVRRLRHVYDEHPGLQDRLIACGVIEPELAAQLGLAGFAGRASAQAWDWRIESPVEPYDYLEVRMATHRSGDVAARVSVRFDEIFESLRLLRAILEALPAGDSLLAALPATPNAYGIGLIEGWRGEVMVALETAADGTLARCHPHDPSWQNWPLLEHAIIDNIVPDFPLINKSFNLSYSGVDL